MDISLLIQETARNAAKNIPTAAEDYYGEDGLLMCGRCHTPKQCRVPLLGSVNTVMCLCQCGGAARDQREHEERMCKLEEAYYDVKRKGEPPSSLLKWFDAHDWRISAHLVRERIELLRYMCFGDTKMHHWRFDTDDGANPDISKAIRSYAAHFEEIASADGLRGLCFFGPCGTGKSYMAGCIANELINQGISVIYTNFGAIRYKLQEDFGGQAKYIQELTQCSCLIIDDLGSESDTEYMREVIFNVINARCLSGRPLIVTTNITGEELKNNKNQHMNRILSRIFEMCQPIEFSGKDKRRAFLSSNTSEFKKRIGLV